MSSNKGTDKSWNRKGLRWGEVGLGVEGAF